MYLKIHQCVFPKKTDTLLHNGSSTIAFINSHWNFYLISTHIPGLSVVLIMSLYDTLSLQYRIQSGVRYFIESSYFLPLPLPFLKPPVIWSISAAFVCYDMGIFEGCSSLLFHFFFKWRSPHFVFEGSSWLDWNSVLFLARILSRWCGIFPRVSHLVVPTSACPYLVMLALVAHVNCCLISPVCNDCILSPLWIINSLLGRPFKGLQRPSLNILPRISIQWWFLPDPVLTRVVANDFPTPVLSQQLSFGSWPSTVGKRAPSSSVCLRTYPFTGLVDS